MAGNAETTPLPGNVDEGFPNSLENKEARTQMRRENAVKSIPKAAIRALERRVGARR